MPTFYNHSPKTTSFGLEPHDPILFCCFLQILGAKSGLVSYVFSAPLILYNCLFSSWFVLKVLCLFYVVYVVYAMCFISMMGRRIRSAVDTRVMCSVLFFKRLLKVPITPALTYLFFIPDSSRIRTVCC